MSRLKRMSRIIWNTNSWIRPSGKYGKGNTKNTHENKHGFGHDEWLFDFDKLIDGYHYGFLEPLREFKNINDKEMYEIHLYTRNSNSRISYYVGCIKNAILVKPGESVEAKKVYKVNGWYDDMKIDLEKVGLDKKQLSRWKDIDLFNVKFKPNDVKIFDPIIELENKDHSNYHRYVFRYYDAFFKNEVDLRSDNYEFIPGDNLNDNVFSANRKRTVDSQELVFLHNKISRCLYRYLVSEYGEMKVSRENKGPIKGQKIDMVVSSKETIFYEIKTYVNPLKSIRESIGQLIEYSTYHDSNRADKLVIVSPYKLSSDEEKYMRTIRENYNIPIYYQQFINNTLQKLI